uniref:chorismate mutase n=1 Tax=Ananas comosus var. bracteatus TaxID=296719 RepID=A0A6V7P4R6_ANACO|nr:unnamed protein product [Ananas comosus var. bracteatus]
MNESSSNCQVLYPAAASVNVSDTIWSVYFEELLPQFTVEGVDETLRRQPHLISRVCRIHYGRFVAEVKFRDSPQDYIPAIRAKNRDTLMKLVTSESQEEIVKKRVEKKAAVFGQDVTLDRPADTGDSNSSRAAYKVDPSVVYRLYGDWVIPLTKIVEIEYLLRRLD